MVQRTKKEERARFYKALKWQPDMVHAMVYLIRNYEAAHQDSAEYFFRRATELIPFWVEPYSAMYGYYAYGLKDFEKAEEMLRLAGEVDSASVLIWYKKGQFYRGQGKYELAEKWHLKTINSINEEICFPCAYNDLGVVYKDIRRYELAEKYFEKAIQLDSALAAAYGNLGDIYRLTQQNEEAENYYRLALQLDSNRIFSSNGLGLIYLAAHRFKEAEQCFRRALQIDNDYASGYYNLGCIESLNNRIDKGFAFLEEALMKDYDKYDWLQEDADFEQLRRHTTRWNALMKKYFPEQHKN